MTEDLPGLPGGDAPSTGKLYRAANCGQREALETLLQRVRPRLEAWISLRIGPELRARIEIDDLVQEILLRASQSIEDLEPRGKKAFYGWLFTIARNQLTEWRRHFGTRKRGAGVKREEIHSGIPAGQDGPSTHVEHREEMERLLRAMEELSEPYREVILLRDFEHRTNEEVARQLGITKKNASVRHLRALKELARLLEGGRKP